MAMALISIGPASAATQVRVIETDPPGDPVTLAPQQSFYLYLDYDSDRPVHILARPYFEGRAVDAGSNPSLTYPAGAGEAIGWFFLFDPGLRVDEVRISAGDGSRTGTSVVTTYPVSIVTGNSAVAAGERPDWVTRLTARADREQRAAAEVANSAPYTAEDTILIYGFPLAVLALLVSGFLWPAWAVWRWRGRWRGAAAVPLAIMLFVVLRIVIDGVRDPTSHNLWPFEVLMAGAVSFLSMAMLAIGRKFAGGGGPG